jgi:HPt (histidine-containing phosphotransfer) domain-containing protein
MTKPIRVDALVSALVRSPVRHLQGAAKTMSEPVLDQTTLDNLRLTTDAEFVRELIDTFLDDSPRLLNEMRQALASGSAEVLRRAAHSLKSNSASLGAQGLSSQAKELELAGKAGQLEGAGPQVDRLAAAYAQVERALRAWQDAQR